MGFVCFLPGDFLGLLFHAHLLLLSKHILFNQLFNTIYIRSDSTRNFMRDNSSYQQVQLAFGLGGSSVSLTRKVCAEVFIEM